MDKYRVRQGARTRIGTEMRNDPPGSGFWSHSTRVMKQKEFIHKITFHWVLNLNDALICTGSTRFSAPAKQYLRHCRRWVEPL